MTTIDIKLHPHGHECSNNVFECRFGRESLHGTMDNKPVTFAVGGPLDAMMLITQGHVSDEQFRKLGSYTPALFDGSIPRPGHTYRIETIDHIIAPADDPHFPGGEAAIVTIKRS